jgi:hypothetical protein
LQYTIFVFTGCSSRPRVPSQGPGKVVHAV